MERGLKSWMTLLAKLGTTKQKAQSRTRIRHAANRKLRFENCEDRRMLAPFTVDSPLDTVDANDGVTTLREAIGDANNAGGLDTINFAASLDGETISLTAGQLPTIIESLTINGEDPSGNPLDITIDAQNNSRIFYINDFNAAIAQTVTITDLALKNGRETAANQHGAAIRSRETLHLDGMRFVNNKADNGHGGAIYLDGDTIAELKINNSEFDGNQSQGFFGGSGGAIYAQRVDSIELTKVLAHGNTATDDGGSLFASSTRIVTVTDSDFHTNSASAESLVI